ncbi:hypothetical protein GUJ93_ZPchr0015g6852 [Zizania palustris]|uniref:DUF7597 domain-containing protein n=1 Tax=Zizania palustris TaxID=103762 RepID=A0A8J5W6Z7_ZIZPA|nr:hypothetical protein GUJ93_ZPchr0015g6852 [Zizania palustris]
MANFPMDPLAYIPKGGVLIDGGGELRKRRNVVSLSGQHLRKHEDLAIANYDENFIALERHEFLLLIHHHLTQVLRLQVLRSWTFPVYIINNELADGFPGDEEDLPPNGGNPHPFNGEVYPSEPNWVQQWVDDQMWHVGFHNAPAAEEAFLAQHVNVDPMVDVEAVPRALSPPNLSRPPIKLVYSRRQCHPTSVNQAFANTDQEIAFGSKKKTDKGKGILLLDLPTIQNFIQASLDDQVGVDKLMAEARDNAQPIPGRININITGDEVDNNSATRFAHYGSRLKTLCLLL